MSDQTSGRRRWPLLPLLLALGGCVAQPYSPATPPVRTAPTGGETLAALEQLTELKEEVKKLRNEVEQMEFKAETDGWRRQNLLQDLDRRLLILEQDFRLRRPDGGVDAASGLAPDPLPGATPGLAPDLLPGAAPGTVDAAAAPGTAGAADVAVVESAAAPPTPTAATPAIIASGDDAVSVAEQQVYDQAFNLLKQSKYRDAIAGFQQLVDTWPASPLADDAYYWISEARYVNREFEAALKGFSTVAARYPDSPRVPEALLKTGYIRYDIGAYEEAAKIFRDLVTRFPGHQVAVSAQTRLRRIEQTIQQ